MNKHTPGPWIADEDGWIKGGDGEVIEYAGCGSHEAYWNKQEDKALVLAAPDLLEALEQLIEFLEPMRFDRKSDDNRAIALEVAARAAIARARGEA